MKKRSIIVEGFDGSGKSTLCNHLSGHFNLPIHHAGPPPRDDQSAIEDCKYQLSRIQQGIICDRVTPISRQCYQLDIDSNHRFELLQFLYDMLEDAILIYCIDNKGEHVTKDYDNYEHLLHITRNKEQIKLRYKELLLNINQSHIPAIIFVYDYTITNLMTMAGALNEYIS